MPRIKYRYPNGTVSEVEVSLGHSVMLGANANGLSGIDAHCGGTLSCATCHVYVESSRLAQLPPPEQMETDMLQCVAAEFRPNSRLSCQIVVTEELDGLTVDVPDRQL